MIPLAVALLLATPGVAAAKPPPDTVIDSGPATLTKSTSASFTFHSTDRTATFTCQLDGGSFVPCTSPAPYSGLAAGGHNFAVDATAGGVSDPSPATAAWTIDLTPPAAPTNLTGSSPTSTSVALSWTAGTDNVGITNNLVLRDGAPLATIGAVTTYTDSTVTAGSTHSYAVEAQDGAGNLSPPSNTVSVTTAPPPPAPDTVIDSMPAALTNSTTASFTFHSTATGATFTCNLDAGKAGSCTSPKTYTGLAGGAHSFSVFSTANSLTDPTPAVANWTIDLTPPSTPTGLTASASATSVTLSWTASTDNVGVTAYDIYRGGSLLTSVGAVTVYADSTVTSGVTYTYSVSARDGAGNASVQSSSVTARPQASFDSHLTRAPYLTDLVGLHVAINFATDQSSTTASVAYGAVGNDGGCSPSTVVQASRITISVGTVFEYQWKGDITLPAAGTYCYRVFLGGTDLLGGNASPAFTTQVQFGSTESFSFVVFGDWGQVDGSGQNAGQANLMAQIAGSGARFAVSLGDNGYPNGSQINYGDLQQSGADTSAIFGSLFWTVPGASIPLFSAVGNHGVSGVKHTDITTWTESTAVSTSGGRYQNDVYCCVNGSLASNYGSEWYAFSAGNVRLYVLDSAWGDTNAGTATPYANDALAHFAPGTPEYTWLLNDLTTHPTQLKFAFSHFPFYSDNPTQPSDSYLDGAANLEGLLGQHGVQLVFNGHAHIYERNRASAGGMPITYVTGGGGGTLEPMGTCSTFDAYAVGWSPTRLAGSACGSATAPTSDSQVFHFLKVTVNGTSITVTPTDSSGRTFDVQTYTFKIPTDTYIDSGPPVGTTSTSATFTFHASGTPATFKCQLDANTQTVCGSPITYSGLAQGNHTFKVTATVNKSVDPTPATTSWTVDTTPPTTPANVAATATSPFTVALTWTAATDNLGVTGYDLFRDGVLYQSLGAVTSYSDAVLGSSTHQYAVRARDIGGNTSALGAAVSVTTPSPPSPVFADGFESGNFSAWSANGGLVIEGSNVNSGTSAADGNTTNGNTFAKKTLPSTYADAYARLWFDIPSQLSQINLLRFRDGAGASIGYVYVDTTGLLGFHNDATGLNTLSGLSPSPGWHALELHVKVDPNAGVVEVWFDNTYLGDLSGTGLNTGSAPVASMQIGEVQAARTYDVVFDDAAFGTARLGPAADFVPPTVPSGLAATAAGPFEADLTWNVSTDDVGLAGYDLFRDGSLLASVGNVLSYADTATTAGSTHTYAVRARDASGNASALTTAVSVTQPAAVPPLFADGFETGDLTSWTTDSGLAVESSDVHAGSYAAEGNTTTGSTFLKKTLPSTYSDAYARVAFEVKSQSSQVTLLRLRDIPTGNGGYLLVTAGGKLAFHNDASSVTTTSSVSPGSGWHVVELHLHVNGTSSVVESWLDGALVPDLTFSTIDLGAAPIGVLQIGETGNGTWDVVFDDAAFGTSRVGPSGDTTAPSVPGNFNGAPSSAFSVRLSWDASTDNIGVTGYDVFRDGNQLAQVATPGFTDNTVLANSTHQYGVRARDASGNISALTAPVSVTTPAAGPPLFADGFETGDLTSWTTSSGLAVESSEVHSGSYAAEGNTSTGATYAKKTVPSTYADAYARVAFEVKTQGPMQVTLLRLRDTPTGNGGYLLVTAGGKLAFHNDASNVTTPSSLSPGSGWHVVELHLHVNGSSSVVETWLDGAAVPDLTFTATDLGSAPIGVLQIGETGSGTWDVVFDDAGFGTSRLGPSADAAPPTVPANLAATPLSPFSVQLSWDASTDNVAVAGYDLFRNGSLLVSLTATSYADNTVLAGTTYQYAVRARDVSGNVSALSGPASVTTPAASAPIFADGFETGNLSAWTTPAGLAVESTNFHSGGFAAEGTTTNSSAYAKEALPSTYPDGYARVAFEVNGPNSQVTLLRLRDTPGGSNGGFIALTSSGKLQFNGAAGASTTSSVTPSQGAWHVLELHLSVSNGVVEVWLDGMAVPDLTLSGANLGTASIGTLQIGDTANGTWDIFFDDAAFGTSRLGTSADTAPPSVPANLAATPLSPFSVQLSWDASTDDAAVAGYDLFRNGALLAHITATAYTDNAALAGTAYQYAVRARDVSGNLSALSAPASVTTPAAATPIFADGFETGDMSAWTTPAGLVAESSTANSGGFGAEGSTTAGATYAKGTLPSTYLDAYAKVAFKVNSQSSQMTLLRLRDTSAGLNGGLVALTSGGKLQFKDAAGNPTTSAVTPSQSAWHVLELHLSITNGVVEVWLDGMAVSDLTLSGANLGTQPMGTLQIGETNATGTWDVFFDDAAFGTSRLGPSGDTSPPSVPANLNGTAMSAVSVQLTWDASTDNIAVTGYDVIRDSAVLAHVSAPGYTDNTVLPNEIHTYAVRARDASGNISALSPSVSVITPAVPDDFSMSASPSSVSVVQGQSGTSTISTTVTSGNAQTVTLSAGGLPAGATASFNPSAVTAGGSSTLTITTTSSTPGGSYTVTVTGTGTSASHSTSVSLSVTVPDDFAISASPSSVSVVQGQSGTSTISTTVTSGNAQTVTLSAGGLPAGATASFNPSAVTAGGSSTLTVSTATSTPGGIYTVTVTGTGYSASHSTSVALTVSVPDDFSISASPSSVSAVQGQSVTSTIGTTVTGGNAQTVTLSATGLPSGATASFNPSSVTAGGSSTLTISTTTSTLGGTYTVTVTGTGASATHSTSVALTVSVPDDFSMGASPSSVSVVQGSSATSSISTSVTSGNAQTLTLSATGLPAGATAAFNPSTVTAGGSSTLTIGTVTSTPVGSYTVTVTGTGASATHSTSVALTVSAPSSGPRFVQMAAAGESASSTTLTATFPAATGAGHLLVLAASVYTGATNQITRVTDPAGNTWTKIGAYCAAGHFSDGELWYAANANSVTSVTVSVTTATVVAIEVEEFSGVATTNPLDVSGGASSTGVAADSAAVTPTTSTELAVGFLAGHGSAQTMTVTTAGYTAQVQQTSANGGSTPVSVVSAYRVLSAAGAQDLTGTFAAPMYWAAGIALFKSA